MREKLFILIEKAREDDQISKIYDYYIMSVACLSVIPLMTRENIPFLITLETITVYLLFLDFVLRWITQDYRVKKHSYWAFILYPFTPFAIMDILSILPSIGLLPKGFMILRLLRLTKVIHYSKSFRHVVNVFKNERKTLLSVLLIAVFYIIVSALIMFVYEPDTTFGDFFDALYWATTALTTVGYGDVYPHTDIGKLISMVSSIFGVAVIAMPAGIVTGGFLDEIHRDIENKAKKAIEVKDEIKMKLTLKGPNIKRYVIFMLIGIFLNLACYQIAHIFHLPVWMDNIGTAYVAIMLEPVAGLLVAFATNFYQASVIYDSSSLVYYAVSASAALCIGMGLRKSGKVNWKRIVIALVVYLAISTILSTVLTLWRTSGIPDSAWERHFYEQFLSFGLPVPLACFLGTIILKFNDCILLAIILPLLYKITPKRFVNKKLEKIVSWENTYFHSRK